MRWYVFREIYRQPPHDIVIKHLDGRVVRRDDNTGTVSVQHRLINTYYYSSPAHIMRKNPVFDGHVLIEVGTYQPLDEGQSEMLKELVVNIVNLQ